MKTIDRDRNSLKRLVESYGKKDVMQYVNHLDEYMLGGNDWGDHTYNDNYYRKYGLANEDEIPYPAMNSLWFLGFFADKFRTILSNNLDPKKDNNPDVRGMRMQEIEYWDKVLDPIAGLMSNKTNIEGDDHQITKQDVLQYRSIYEKLLTSPVNLLKSSAQQLVNFCKEISDSRRVGESVKTDRNTLKALVEAYGKKDVVNYINHLDEVYHIGDEVPDYSRARNEHDVNTAKYNKALEIAYRCQRQICDSLDNDRQMCYDHAVYAREAIKDVLGGLLNKGYIFGEIVSKFSELSSCFAKRPAVGQNTDRKYIVKLLTDLRDLLNDGKQFVNS